MLSPHQIQSSFDSFLRPFFQSSCSLCERSTQHELCSFCLRQLTENQEQHLSIAPSELSYWGLYQGALKRAIAQLKYADRPGLGHLLGEELGLALLRQGLVLSKIRLVAIPLHPDRLKSRKYNQAEIIAKKLAQVTGAHYVAKALNRHRPTPALHNLSPRAREQAVRGAFSLGALQSCDRHKPILLVDDIYTTGTTMREAERVLKKHHFKVAGKVVIAKTEAVFP